MLLFAAHNANITDIGEPLVSYTLTNTLTTTLTITLTTILTITLTTTLTIDTIDHNILINRLTSIGISDTALYWFI